MLQQGGLGRRRHLLEAAHDRLVPRLELGVPAVQLRAHGAEINAILEIDQRRDHLVRRGGGENAAEVGVEVTGVGDAGREHDESPQGRQSFHFGVSPQGPSRIVGAADGDATVEQPGPSDKEN